MRTKITFKWLEDVDACEDGVEYYKTLGETDLFRLIERGIEDSELDYCNWLIARCMDHKQALRYALYAAESVLHMYEDAYPDDNRPRMAIEAVKAVIKRDSKKNRESADVESCKAYDAFYSLCGRINNAASLAAYVAGSVAGVGYDQTSVEAIAKGSANAFYYYTGSLSCIDDQMTRILRHGIKMIKGEI